MHKTKTLLVTGAIFGLALLTVATPAEATHRSFCDPVADCSALDPDCRVQWKMILLYGSGEAACSVSDTGIRCGAWWIYGTLHEVGCQGLP